MAIKVKKHSKYYTVRFPYELKDSFKETFKSAKWDRESMCWVLGPRSGKRLEQWVALAEQAAKDIEDADSAQLTKEELESLEEQFKNIQSKIRKHRQKEENAHATVDMLQAAKERLESAKNSETIARARAVDAAKKAEALLHELCDMSKIYSAFNIMQSRQAGPRKTYLREQFEEARSELKAEYAKLRTAGIGSRGIDQLLEANFNRPDRDDLSKITVAQILETYRCD